MCAYRTVEVKMQPEKEIREFFYTLYLCGKGGRRGEFKARPRRVQGKEEWFFVPPTSHHRPS